MFSPHPRFLFTRFVAMVLLLICCSTSSVAQEDEAPAKPGDNDQVAESLGWKLGVQTYSFNRFTFFEAIDKAASIGLKYAECYPGQKISSDVEGTIGPNMTPEQFELVQKKLKEAKVKLVAFGVVGLSADEQESRKVFEFCKRLGIGVINTEVNEKAFDTLEKLCDEYEIYVGLHNHPQPSYYWNPDKIVEVTQGRSKWIGACADTGHWLRSSLEPLECLKKLEGRLVSFHFKDLNRKDRSGHDVPWGQGVVNVKELIAEMKRQNFQGPISVEYEHNWLESLPEIAQSVENFHRITSEAN
jgi:sugar phosphate isomerase/epimerase